MNKQIKRILFVCLSIVIYAITLCGCSSQTKTVSESAYYFDTIITITLYDTDDNSDIKECFKLAQQYEALLSNTIIDSDISNINANPNEFVAVASETIDILEKALDFSKTNPSFDITIGKISELWNISQVSAQTNTKDNEVDESYIPDINQLQELARHVDYHSIQISDNSVSLTDEKAKIDLGGIAKGYIADQMKVYLNSKGHCYGIINLGGNVLTLGEKPTKDTYKIGIRKPFSENGDAILKVMVTDNSIVTSGVYERYFTVNGKRYHHILDKTTGYPVENNLYSVTIINDSSMLGDALSTSVYMMGLEDGMSYIESLENTEAIFITDHYDIIVSSGLSLGKDYEIIE